MLHPNSQPNMAPGLLNALHRTTGQGLVAYLAAVIAHTAFTETFADELTTPGVRAPITCDPSLWAEALERGERSSGCRRMVRVSPMTYARRAIFVIRKHTFDSPSR